jgi:hypothetical protein
MIPREKKLIERLKERVKDPGRASDEGLAKVHIPAKAKIVTAVERKLGFQLPDLLRGIYTQVGNGGFGPEYGFIGIEGGAKPEGKTLVPQYNALQCLAKKNPYWRWPEQLLPVCYLGCGMWSCLDCAGSKVPVMIFDPNLADQDEDDRNEAVLGWTIAFWHEASSFASWLTDWMEGRSRPEPKWPSKTWLRKRLWPNEPANVNIFLNAK